MPLVAGDLGNADERVVTGAEAQPRWPLDLEPRHPRAQRPARDDAARRPPPHEAQDLLEDEERERRAGEEEQARRVEDREAEPRDVEEVGEVEELEFLRLSNEPERERPHQREN